jgi:hypothetical protein
MHEVSIVSTDDTSAYSAQLDKSLFCKTQDFTNQTMYDCQLIPFESKTIHDLLSEKTSFLKPATNSVLENCFIPFVPNSFQKE